MPSPDRSGASDLRLRRLLANAREGQWSPDDAIDWALGPALPLIWPRQAFAGAVAKLYHGEKATAAFCGHLLEHIDDPVMAECIRLQEGDESRHAQVYARYLRRMGREPGPQPGLSAVYRIALAWDGPVEAQILAYHVVLESEAMNLLDIFMRRVPCPLFQQINRRIMRDEARHVAFGKIFLQQRLPRLSDAERREIYLWIKALWWKMAEAALGDFTGKAGGVLRVFNAKVEQQWSRQRDNLLGIGLINESELAVLEAQP